MNNDSDDVSQTRELLDRFWAAADPEGGTARGGAEPLIAQAEHRNRDLPPSTEAALLRFDEFLLWTVSLATALNFTRSPSGSPAAVYGALAGGISSLLFSIRSLVLSGFDVPAKILMRSVVEYADVLFLLFPLYASSESALWQGQTGAGGPGLRRQPSVSIDRGASSCPGADPAGRLIAGRGSADGRRLSSAQKVKTLSPGGSPGRKG